MITLLARDTSRKRSITAVKSKKELWAYLTALKGTQRVY